ncbi:hypothetical protein DLAC_08185 [Tieghemostelium lacteum]|uniref:Uncharacterized protein n=1 Tax=Tieghemostelium lacteum TaxID=361077 RepID=A0A151ZBC8_TIELA|nr:hypothetical protein DLAC_08185 [Tieghemostelium lacteum]|eukprot:KYQ91252.1 hypothetical protein DLAC_08185 [Tieghemostelium lacteum]
MVTNRRFYLLKEKWKRDWISLDFSHENLQVLLKNCMDIEFFKQIENRYKNSLKDITSSFPIWVIRNIQSAPLLEYLLDNGYMDFSVDLSTIDQELFYLLRNQEIWEILYRRYPKFQTSAIIREYITYIISESTFRETSRFIYKSLTDKLIKMGEFKDFLTSTESTLSSVLNYILIDGDVESLQQLLDQQISINVIGSVPINHMTELDFEKFKLLVKHNLVTAGSYSPNVLFAYHNSDALEFYQKSLFSSFQDMEAHLQGDLVVYQVSVGVVTYLIENQSTLILPLLTLLYSQIPWEMKKLFMDKNLVDLNSFSTNLVYCKSLEELEYVLSRNDFRLEYIDVYFDESKYYSILRHSTKAIDLIEKYCSNSNNSPINIELLKNLLSIKADINVIIYVYERVKDSYTEKLKIFNQFATSTSFDIQKFIYDHGASEFWYSCYTYKTLVLLVMEGRYQFLDYLLTVSYEETIQNIIKVIQNIIELSTGFNRVLESIHSLMKPNGYNRETIVISNITYAMIHKLPLLYQVFNVQYKPFKPQMDQVLKKGKIYLISHLINMKYFQISDLYNIDIRLLNHENLYVLIQGIQESHVKDQVLCTILFRFVQLAKSNESHYFTEIFLKIDHQCNPKTINEFLQSNTLSKDKSMNNLLMKLKMNKALLTDDIRDKLIQKGFECFKVSK